jgi:hypothetical protein
MAETQPVSEARFTADATVRFTYNPDERCIEMALRVGLGEFHVVLTHDQALALQSGLSDVVAKLERAKGS